MATATLQLPSLLKILSDPTRLRILGLLELEELSVGELSRGLGMAQSRVSNHLRVLREGQFLAERHVGTSTFLRPALGDAGRADAPLAARLWTTLHEGLQELPEHTADRQRLRVVLRERRKESVEFFDRVAGEWDKIGASFQSGQARQRSVANLLGGGMTVADLGCGTGYMARALVGIAQRVILVDRSRGMLEEAERQLASAPTGTSVEFREGELDRLPIGDGEVDGAVAGMVLHHLQDLDGPISEMLRILKPGGTAVVLELAPHREAWMQGELGDRHLGLSSSDVAESFRRNGFDDVAIESVDDRYCPTPTDPNIGTDAVLPLYIVRGRKARGRLNGYHDS